MHITLFRPTTDKAHELWKLIPTNSKRHAYSNILNTDSGCRAQTTIVISMHCNVINLMGKAKVSLTPVKSLCIWGILTPGRGPPGYLGDMKG